MHIHIYMYIHTHIYGHIQPLSALSLAHLSCSSSLLHLSRSLFLLFLNSNNSLPNLLPSYPPPPPFTPLR